MFTCVLVWKEGLTGSSAWNGAYRLGAAMLTCVLVWKERLTGSSAWNGACRLGAAACRGVLAWKERLTGSNENATTLRHTSNGLLVNDNGICRVGQNRIYICTRRV